MPFQLRGPPEEAAAQFIKHLQATGVLDARGEVLPQRAQGASEAAERPSDRTQSHHASNNPSVAGLGAQPPKGL